jgi:hypothetical protein
MSQVVSSGPLDLLESCSRLHTLNLFGNNPKTDHEDPFTEWTRKIEQSYRVCHPPSIAPPHHSLRLLTIPCASSPTVAPSHIHCASSPTVAPPHQLLRLLTICCTYPHRLSWSVETSKALLASCATLSFLVKYHASIVWCAFIHAPCRPM